MNLQIFYSKNPDIMPAIKDALEKTYRGLRVRDIDEMVLTEHGYNPERSQYYANTPLEELIQKKSHDLGLWVVHEDLYTRNMNFIFGIAIYGRGAIVSTFRLDSLELIEKECVHEIGHVLGLDHCRNYCVMRFSNSLYEAKQKPGYLCEECKRKLKNG